LGLAGSVRVMANVGADVIRVELSDSAIFLHTCPVEGFGLVVAEAMAAGCLPCVIRAGGLTELVPPETTFASPGEAVQILSKLIGGWRPLNREQLRQIVAEYDILKFQQRWVDFVREKVS